MEVRYTGTTRNYTRLLDPITEGGYYVAPKERTRRTDPYQLTATQQRIVEILKVSKHPLTLGEIAAQAKITSNDAANALKRLSTIEPIYEEGHAKQPLYAYLRLED